MASLGRSCVVPEKLETAIITKHVYRISIEHDLLDVDFYNYLLQAEWATRRHMMESSTGQTRPGLNSTVLKTLPVPILDKCEQVEITRILDERLSAADALEAEIDAGLTRVEDLRQSILKQAFSGKLVPQDPNDEPASVLLERIKAEKAKAPKPKRKRKATA
jgi:type I restriction enzyme S subunit